MKRWIGFLSFVVAGFFFLNSCPAQTTNKQLAVTNEKYATMNLTNEIIHQRVEMYLLKNYHENHDEIVVTCDPVAEAIPVDYVDWEIKVDSKYSRIKNGPNLVDVTVFSRKKIYKKFSLKANISTYDDIVVATTMLERSQTLSDADVTLQRVETTHFKRDYFTMVEDVLNLQTKQIINKDKPIFTGMIEIPDVIHRGDIIKIVVRLKNMEITAIGKALQDGKRGEKIKVQNNATGKKLSAEVLDDKTVLVEL